MASPEVTPQNSGDYVFDASLPLAVIGYELIQGRETLVYDINNLPALYKSFTRLEGLDETAEPSMSDRAIELNWHGARDILLAHAERYPDRLREIVEFNQSLRQAEHDSSVLGSVDLEWRRIVIHSEAYKEIEPIAHEYSPEFNPRELCM